MQANRQASGAVGSGSGVDAVRRRQHAIVGLATLPVAGYVGGFACILNFDDVPPGIGLAANSVD